MSGQPAPPAWVALACDRPVLGASRARWGFRHETWIAQLSDGERLVVQRRVGGPDPMATEARAVRERVRATGLAAPEPSGSVRVDGDTLVVLPWLEGEVAADLLATPEGAAIAGRACGEVAAQLAGIDATGLRLPDTWASGRSLRAAVTRWLEGLGSSLTDLDRDRVDRAAERMAREVDAGGARFAHGDLAPVNVLVRDGRAAAVLDLDRACLAYPGHDADWFAWVVGFHHPDVAGSALAGFARASGLGGGGGAAQAPDALPPAWPLLLLERAAETIDEEERVQWIGRLRVLPGAGPDGPGARAV